MSGSLHFTIGYLNSVGMKGTSDKDWCLSLGFR
jgi:hypothetical protein